MFVHVKYKKLHVFEVISDRTAKEGFNNSFLLA